MSKFLSMLICMIFLFMLVSCSTDEKENLSEFVGYVGSIQSEDESRILVIPDVSEEALDGLSEQEIMQLAIQKKGIYFTVNKKELDTLKKGLKVKVFYDASLGAEESLPPIRPSEKVEVLKS